MRRLRFTASAAAILTALVLGGCGLLGDPAEEPAITTGAIHGRALLEGAAEHGGIRVILQRTLGAAPASIWAAAEGAPLAAAPGDAIVAELATTTSADGAYAFFGLAPGVYTVYAQAEHALTGFLAGVEARAGDETEADDLLLTPTGAVAGTVTLEGETEHVGVVVFVAGTSLAAFTDAAGAYRIDAVPVGTHALMAARWDYQTAAIGDAAVAMGETAVVDAYELALLPAAAPRVVHTFPSQGAVARIPDKPLIAEYAGDSLVMMLQFSNAMIWESVLERLAVDPPVEYYTELIGDALLIRTATDWEPDYLRFHTEYTVTVAAGGQDVFGNAMLEPFALSFSTGGLEVSYTRPAPGDTVSAGLYQRITIYGNAPLAPGHWPSAETVVFDPPVTGEWETGYDGIPYMLDPDVPLLPNADYAVSVDGFMDVHGAELDAPHVFSFHTGPVRLVSISPEDGAEAVSCGDGFTLGFSAAMDFGEAVAGLTLSPPIAIRRSGGGSGGDVTRYGFVPDRDDDDARFWPASTEITVTINQYTTGYHGDPLENPTSFTFTTAPFGLVRSWPRDGATGVGRSQYVTLELDNVVDPSTVGESISISPPMNFNAYVVDYHDVRVVNHLLWDPGTEYTITISTGLQTDTGVPLAEETSISFTIEGI